MQIYSISGYNSNQINRNKNQSQPNFGARKEVELAETLMNKAKYHKNAKIVMQGLSLDEVNGKLNKIGSSVIAAVKKSFYSNDPKQEIKVLGNNKGLQISKKSPSKGEQVLATMRIVPADNEVKGMVEYIDYETHQIKRLVLDDQFNMSVKSPEFK